MLITSFLTVRDHVIITALMSIHKELLPIRTVVRMDMKDDGCPEDLFNITLSNTPFDYAPWSINPSFIYDFPPEK
jgi:hypothetical protein